MVIKINDIPPEGLTLELAQRLDLFDEGKDTTAFTAVFSLKPAGGARIRVTGRVKAEPALDCSRCLKSFAFTIDTEVNFDFAPLSSLGANPEHELDRGELDTEFYEGDEIDMVSVAKEHLLLAIPMVSLHSPDCKGLCPVCGTNLNDAECTCRKDARDEFNKFSKLKDLFKK